MSSLVSDRWRMRLAIGCFAGVGMLLYPLGGMAQTGQPSGAAVEVGGVTAPAPSGAPVEVGGVTPEGAAPEVAGVTAPGGLPATGGGPATSVQQPSVAGAQGRTLILPNTGGGPQQDFGGLLAILVAALVAIGGAAYLRLRASRRGVGG